MCCWHHTHFALARASGALDDMAKIGRAEFTERCWGAFASMRWTHDVRGEQPEGWERARGWRDIWEMCAPRASVRAKRDSPNST